MEMKDYYPRICDRILQNKLKITGAVLIVGAKWCGKTETALQSANSVLFIQESPQHKEMAKMMPSLLLEGETPRLIDEWQDAPEVWDAVRHTVDKRKKPGQFILTGSATPRDEVKAHTGIGRISRILMRPMSLFESEESLGVVSLRDLFNGNHTIEAVSKLEIPQIARLICRGGWSGAIICTEHYLNRFPANSETVLILSLHRLPALSHFARYAGEFKQYLSCVMQPGCPL